MTVSPDFALSAVWLGPAELTSGYRPTYYPCVVGATSLARHFACASASSSATARPRRSNRPARALRTTPLVTRSARPRPSGPRSGASLEVWSPTALVSRVALVSVAASHRTIPLRRFAARPSSVLRSSQGGARPCGFSRFSRDYGRRRSSWRTFEMGRSIVANMPALSRRSRIHRSTGRESRCLRSAGRVRSVKPIDTRS